MPVLDQQLDPVQLLARGLGRAQIELVVDVPGIPRIEHLQALFHRQPGRHHEDVLREAPALFGIGDGIQRLPRHDHAHDQGLARARGHLRAQPLPGPAIARHMDPLLEIRRRLDPPDQRLDGLVLAKVEGEVARAAIPPMVEQPARHRGHARKIRRAPFGMPLHRDDGRAVDMRGHGFNNAIRRDGFDGQAAGASG